MKINILAHIFIWQLCTWIFWYIIWQFLATICFFYRVGSCFFHVCSHTFGLMTLLLGDGIIFLLVFVYSLFFKYSLLRLSKVSSLKVWFMLLLIYLNFLLCSLSLALHPRNLFLVMQSGRLYQQLKKWHCPGRWVKMKLKRLMRNVINVLSKWMLNMLNLEM